MEERAEIMTDRQFEGMLRMILKIAEGCPTREKILEAIEDLLEDKRGRKDSKEERPDERK